MDIMRAAVEAAVQVLLAQARVEELQAAKMSRVRARDAVSRDIAGAADAAAAAAATVYVDIAGSATRMGADEARAYVRGRLVAAERDVDAAEEAAASAQARLEGMPAWARAEAVHARLT